MYDAIVVGARCAGASTAMLLARRGHRVLLVDRAVFPGDIPQGHFVHRGGPARLARWGVLDAILATGSPPVTTMIQDAGDFELVGEGLEQDGVPFAFGPRRFALDKVLVDAAVEAGVELREGFVVEGYEREGDRVTGIRGRATRGGGAVTQRAAITVGADGRNSRLARTVGAEMYRYEPPQSCWYFTYFGDVQARGVEVRMREGSAVFAFPTNDGLFAVFVAWPAAEFPAVRADIEGRFMAAIDQSPELAARVRCGRRAERFYGATDVPNFLRTPRGPGWALVGDAGMHKDPFLALGVCDALRDAELLADAIHDGLAGRRPMAEALAGYQRGRDAETIQEYEENLVLARLAGLPPEALQLRAALRGDAEQTARFFMAREGLIPRQSFFTPENLERILSRA
jgi:flavin-dependent dehydrogenase